MTSPDTLRFSELALAAPVLQTLEKIGYEVPSPIQAQSIPPILAGRDLMGVAQTGTGKTAAFALPLLSNIDCDLKQPQVLVLAPTRELAIQVAEAFKTYAGQLKGFHVLPIYGGADMGGQLKALRRGPQVVVGTPGRVMDHLRRKTLVLDQLKAVVLDEADEMLRMGFIEDVNWILEHTPQQRQIALFSATMPAPIKKLSKQYLRDPVSVKIEATQSSMAQIEQSYWLVKGANKLEALTRILEVEPFDGIIMFARTKNMTVELADKLDARGYRTAAINGDITQKLRERTIDQLKKNKIDILVATDVAARGIDVARISHVINFDIPYDPEAYVHRIGRTGRAGRSGKAILFVAPRERHLLRAIEKATGQSVAPMDLPSREVVQRQREDRFIQRTLEVGQSQDLDFYHRLVQRALSDGEVDIETLAASLAYMAQETQPLVPETPQFEPSQRSSGASERSDKRPGKSQRQKQDDVPMESFRIAVGRKHDVKPGDIVGAIANEAGVESRYIGRIELGDLWSTIGLPEGMPGEVFAKLKTLRVRGQPLNIERSAGPQSGKRPPSPPAKKGKKRPALERKKLEQKKKKAKGGKNA
ncbi:MAG: DEAD/DEAH box helicase [Pseudomonadota bacterium]